MKVWVSGGETGVSKRRLNGSKGTSGEEEVKGRNTEK